MTARVGPEQSYVTFGSGCAGSLGVTRLIPISMPRLGQTLTVNLDNLPLDQAIMILGFSNTTSVLGSLPLNLDLFGMPGCAARVSPDLSWPLFGADGWAAHTLIIPNLPELLGSRFYQQALVPDPNADNPANFVISDATAAVVGR